MSLLECHILNAADGIGAAARFDNPTSVVRVGDNLYVSDRDNHVIRKIVIETGEVTTLAGKAKSIYGDTHVDGAGEAARFSRPGGITSDGIYLMWLIPIPITYAESRYRLAW